MTASSPTDAGPRRGTVSNTAGSAAATGRALLRLADAELSLAGSALVRSVLIAVAAVALAAVSTLLIAGLAVLALQALGLSWLLSLSIVTLAALTGCAYAIRRSRHLLQHCALRATRRQLVAMFADDDDDADQPADDQHQIAAAEPGSERSKEMQA